MIERENLNNSFNNPFEDINANVMEPRKILEFWCDPFSSGFLTEISEKEFYTEKMPIVLEGSRGSGKTTILKYFSYNVQLELSKNKKNHSFTDQVQSDGGVGIYFRCDESFIKAFQVIFSMQTQSQWSKAFEHYLELYIVRNLLEIIDLLDNHEEFEDEILDEFRLKLSLDFENFYCFRQYIYKEISYIDSYKNNAVFTDEKFKPSKVLAVYQISSLIIDVIKKNEVKWKNINVLLLIDEFENLDIELQKMFNNLIKFTRGHISLRIGRRSEGLVTKQTVNDTEEYLRENHDYRLISLLKDRNINEVRQYFTEIAQKRFESYQEFCDEDVSDIFGSLEDLDCEAKEISDGKKEHIYQILKRNGELAANEALLYQVASIIEFDDNPIAEMLNALWVIRNKGDKLEAAKSTIKIMKSVFSREENQSKEAIKYKSDYNNKYRYSLVGLMCSIYKKPKLYYSLNTICHLSNSNARMFINFCRAIINDALFYEKEQFLTTKRVSKETQSKAIHEVSQDEFKNVCSIIQHGNKIRNLVQNLGNVFSDFSRDRKVRYPETNQFVFDYEELDEEYRKIIDTAENWAVILKRKKTQRVSIGIPIRDYIYYINRSYTPMFNISYRTRGGYNVSFTKDEIEQMCKGQTVIYKIDKNRSKNADEEKTDYEQISLFEVREQDE